MQIKHLLMVFGLILPLCTQALALQIEPDDFFYLAPLTNATQGVTLTLSQGDGEVRPDFTIVSLSNFGIPSTGNSFFGARSSAGYGAQFFFSSANLRADFQSLMKTVSIDFIGCCDVAGAPLTTGLLRAFSSSGTLLGSYTTGPLHRNAIETGVVTMPQANIAYVMASTTEGSNATFLDNFSASPIPEPANQYLLGSGLLVLASLCRTRGRSSS